jgi:hypothetical protein
MACCGLFPSVSPFFGMGAAIAGTLNYYFHVLDYYRTRCDDRSGLCAALVRELKGVISP